MNDRDFINSIYDKLANNRGGFDPSDMAQVVVDGSRKLIAFLDNNNNEYVLQLSNNGRDWKYFDANRYRPTNDAYELTILTKEDLNPVEVAREIDRIIWKYNGEITKYSDDGIKRLAYAINNNERARYLYYDVELANGMPAKLSAELNRTDNVLRYLLVRTPKNDRR